MAMRKKGIIFTLMAILMVTIVIFAIRPQLISYNEQRIPLVENRVDVANSHLTYLENTYLERMLRYCSFNALNTYTRYLRYKYAENQYSPTTTAQLF